MTAHSLAREAGSPDVVVWLGASGGLGVTETVANELRAGDLGVDLDFAHAALAARAGARGNGADVGGLLAFDPGRIDQLAVLSTVVEVPARPGVRIVAAPRHPEIADAIDPQRLSEFLSVAVSEYRRVLVDAGSRFGSIVDCACAVATRIVVVASDEAAGLERAGDIAAFLRRAAVGARIELDLRDPRTRRSVPAGRAAFALGVAPYERERSSGWRMHRLGSLARARRRP